MSNPKARIRLESDDKESLNFVISQIKAMAKVLNMKINGPIFLPTKKLTITTRRTPCGDGSDTYERWQKRVSRRILEVVGDNKALRQLLRIKVPDNVYVKIILV